MKHEILIIGAGASGLTSAIACKDFGLDVAILEGTDRIGKKILTTGNGRCNIGNLEVLPCRYHSNNKNFFKTIIEDFTSNETINFFSALGLPIITLEDNKMFPMSLQASSVVDIFRMSIEDKNIPIYSNCKVKKIEKTSKGFTVLTSNDEVFKCSKIVLATGGLSYPKTGSDGSGYTLAKALGHNVTKTFPAIVQLKLNYARLKALSGVKFQGSAEIFINNKPLRKECGEILFTDYGISGPPILQLSRIVSTASKDSSISLKIDMFPHMDTKETKAFLENHLGMFGYRSVCDAFIGIINKKLIPIILKEAKIDDIHKPCWSLTWEEKSNLLVLLKDWTFEVSGTKSFNEAQVTAGGIDTKDVNPLTLESTLIENLYFAGEVLDVDGDCGGFNLHWAFASGSTVAKAIYSKLNN